MRFLLHKYQPPHVGQMREWTTNMRVPRVCIVGAGMAGLRCADLFLESGLHVSLFEARDRIGGRVSLSLLYKAERRLGQVSSILISRTSS